MRRARILLVALLALPAGVEAQADEPPVVDPAAFPPLPEVPPELAEQVERLRRTVRRMNRCRIEIDYEWVPERCDDWMRSIRNAPPAVRVHAVGLEYVRHSMIDWPDRGITDFENQWLRSLGQDFDRRYRDRPTYPEQIPYLIRALSVLTRSDVRHHENAATVIRLLRYATLQPIVGLAIEGHEDAPEPERRRLIREAWLEFARRTPVIDLPALRESGAARAESMLESESSAVLLEGFIVRWSRNWVRAEWAALCRRVIRSPVLDPDDYRIVVGYCTAARIPWREQSVLRRDALRERRERAAQ